MKLFNLYGLIIMISIMLPNIIFSYKNKGEFNNKYKNKIIEFFEQIGRYGIFCFMIINIPFLTKGYWFDHAEQVYIIVNSMLTIFYCLLWIVFWNKNNVAKALLLSVIPSIIFIFSGIVLLNIPLIILSILFAVCHIKISYRNAIV